MIKKILIKVLSLLVKLFYIIKNNFSARLLKNYSSAVSDIETCHPLKASKRFAIFVYYEPSGIVSQSVKNILGELRNNSVNTILISNSDLSDEQNKVLRNFAQCIIVRENNWNQQFVAFILSGSLECNVLFNFLNQQMQF